MKTALLFAAAVAATGSAFAAGGPHQLPDVTVYHTWIMEPNIGQMTGNPPAGQAMFFRNPLIEEVRRTRSGPYGPTSVSVSGPVAYAEYFLIEAAPGAYSGSVEEFAITAGPVSTYEWGCSAWNPYGFYQWDGLDPNGQSVWTVRTGILVL